MTSAFFKHILIEIWVYKEDASACASGGKIPSSLYIRLSKYKVSLHQKVTALLPYYLQTQRSV